MAYPTAFEQLIADHVVEERGNALIEKTIRGDVVGRVLTVARPKRFAFDHVLSDSEFATLLTFYKNNAPPLTFTFTWTGDAATYTVLFVTPPQRTMRYKGTSPGLSRYRVELMEKGGS